MHHIEHYERMKMPFTIFLVGASGMLWTGQWVSESVSESVRDICMSHQSDWIYYKQPIKFFLATRGNLTLLFHKGVNSISADE